MTCTATRFRTETRETEAMASERTTGRGKTRVSCIRVSDELRDRVAEEDGETRSEVIRRL